MNGEDIEHWARDIDRIVRDTIYTLTYGVGLRSELIDPHKVGGVYIFEGVVYVSAGKDEFRLLFAVSHTDDLKGYVVFELFDERDTGAKLWDESYSTAQV